MLIQKKPKPVGEPVTAVQFIGDPGVHPQIFWDTSPGSKPHWRIGGEDHGGPFDSGSSYLARDTWIAGEGATLMLISPDTLARDWQVVAGEPQPLSRFDCLQAVEKELEVQHRKLTESALNMDYVINPAVWERAERIARDEFDTDLRRLGFEDDAILALHRVAKDRDIAPGMLLQQAVLSAIGLRDAEQAGDCDRA